MFYIIALFFSIFFIDNAFSMDQKDLECNTSTENENCSICLDKLPVRWPAKINLCHHENGNHSFCVGCIKGHLEGNGNDCPLCRRPLACQEKERIFFTHDLVETNKFQFLQNDKYFEQRKALATTINSQQERLASVFGEVKKKLEQKDFELFFVQNQMFNQFIVLNSENFVLKNQNLELNKKIEELKTYAYQNQNLMREVHSFKQEVKKHEEEGSLFKNQQLIKENENLEKILQNTKRKSNEEKEELEKQLQETKKALKPFLLSTYLGPKKIAVIEYLKNSHLFLSTGFFGIIFGAIWLFNSKK